MIQFAYRQGRGTDDAVNTVVHLILKHLDKPKAYARLLFIDFSLAFNLIQPHTLLTKLTKMNVNPYIIKWYNFFSNRQSAAVNQTLSQTVVTNTGAPQGCVSSPILYILYTNDCTSSNTNNYTFSDDPVFLVCYMLILTSVCTLLKCKALYIGVTTTTSNSILVRLKR